jgi:hypothetical protein
LLKPWYRDDCKPTFRGYAEFLPGEIGGALDPFIAQPDLYPRHGNYLNDIYEASLFGPNGLTASALARARQATLGSTDQDFHQLKIEVDALQTSAQTRTTT